MKTKIVLIGILLLFLQSCVGADDWPTIDESSPTTTTTYLQLSPNNFGLCSAFYEGTKEFSVVISVDIVDGNGVLQSNHYLNEQTINNDDLDTSTDLFKYEIDVPETGSYIVSITYSTTDCFVCCDHYTCDAYDAYGNQWLGGKPLYRGIKMLRNQSAAPSDIFITLERQCF